MLWSFVHDVAIGQLDYVDTNFFESYPGISATVEGIKEESMMKAYKEYSEKALGANAN
jgi:hypothetical protein